MLAGKSIIDRFVMVVPCFVVIRARINARDAGSRVSGDSHRRGSSTPPPRHESGGRRDLGAIRAVDLSWLTPSTR
jgi:hypothetical protein